MTVVGLTGGIGSGKSTVSRLLAERGAVVIDADIVARQVTGAGSEALEAISRRFGREVLTTEGELDRPTLAGVVFADEKARGELEAIVHPAVGRAIAERLAELASNDGVVVLDVPLLAESGRERYPVAGVLVVDCPVGLALSRLVAQRAMSEADVRARVAAQATRAERLAIADYVISNTGTLEELSEMVELAWGWILSL